MEEYRAIAQLCIWHACKTNVKNTCPAKHAWAMRLGRYGPRVRAQTKGSEPRPRAQWAGNLLLGPWVQAWANSRIHPLGPHWGHNTEKQEISGKPTKSYGNSISNKLDSISIGEIGWLSKARLAIVIICFVFVRQSVGSRCFV